MSAQQTSFIMLMSKLQEYNLAVTRWYNDKGKPTADPAAIQSLSTSIDALKVEIDSYHRKLLHPTLTAGNFSWHPDTEFRDMLTDAYKATDAVPGAWNWFRTQLPPEDKGYMFWGDAIGQEISRRMQYNHSGASYGAVMRILQRMAYKGWDTWVQEELAATAVAVKKFNAAATS
jgi:hypothetical protein